MEEGMNEGMIAKASLSIVTLNLQVFLERNSGSFL